MCAATTDLWKSGHQQIDYISLTVHYLRDWQLVSRVLFTAEIDVEEKSATDVLSVLLSNFCALGLTEHQFEKMFFVTD